MPPLRSRLLLAVVAAVFTSVFFIDFCNLVYACGCRSLWAGADVMCNVHNAHGRHCPWCSIGLLPSVGIWLAIVTVQAVAALKFMGVWSVRVLVVLAAFPLVGGLIAVTMGWAQGYWQ